jgi:hypothetical protein
VLESLRKLKEMKRNLDRLMEKYDSVLQRYFGLSKFRDPSSFREDAFQLFDARRSYLKSSLEFAFASNNLKFQLEQIFSSTACLVATKYQQMYDKLHNLWGSLSETLSSLEKDAQKVKVH